MDFSAEHPAAAAAAAANALHVRVNDTLRKNRLETKNKRGKTETEPIQVLLRLREAQRVRRDQRNQSQLVWGSAEQQVE